MTKTHILRGLCLLTLALPVPALAYLTPEDVLNSDQNQMYFNPPPSARDTAQIQAQQQSSDAALRAQQQAALFSSSSSSAPAVTGDTLHGAAPAQTADQGAASSSALTEQDVINQRILARVKADQLAAQAAADAQVLVSQQSLHSGAPLASSGPGLDLLIGVLAVAGVWTLWRARRMEKKI